MKPSPTPAARRRSTGHRSSRPCARAGAITSRPIKSLRPFCKNGDPRLDVMPDRAEFDLRWVADIRYALGRWPALVTWTIRFGRRSKGRTATNAVAGSLGGAAWLFRYGNFACCAVTALAACLAHPAFALDPRYPDWPCQQLKVPGISIASVWTGPSIEGIDTTKFSDPKEADLVSRLAARRTPIEEARELIAEFIVGTNEKSRKRRRRLFAALYSTLNAQRDQVMSGIERFSRKQKATAEEIRDGNPEDAGTAGQRLTSIRRRPMNSPASLSWQTRIFEDRRKSTSYVCDVPVLIEKRLFELGKAIQQVLNAGEPAK